MYNAHPYFVCIAHGIIIPIIHPYVNAHPVSPSKIWAKSMYYTQQNMVRKGGRKSRKMTAFQCLMHKNTKLPHIFFQVIGSHKLAHTLASEMAKGSALDTSFSVHSL